MTKAQEIEAFKAFRDSLPANSYLRPWLIDITPQVEDEIRSDFPVSPSMIETRKLCEGAIKAARSEAEYILTSAKNAAANREAEARRNASDVSACVAAAMRKAIRDLGH